MHAVLVLEEGSRDGNNCDRDKNLQAKQVDSVTESQRTQDPPA